MDVSLDTDFSLSLAMAAITAALLGPALPRRRFCFYGVLESRQPSWWELAQSRQRQHMSRAHDHTDSLCCYHGMYIRQDTCRVLPHVHLRVIQKDSYISNAFEKSYSPSSLREATTFLVTSSRNLRDLVTYEKLREVTRKLREKVTRIS